ncbi:MAG: reverse transcriptase domain-containing protein [Thermomicrobiales bacterium]
MATDLADRILHRDTLRFAWRRVEANRGLPGADGVSIARFRLRLEENLLTLADEVRDGTYQPGPVRRTSILTGTTRRTISILPVRDRVLQRAALDVLTPVIDPTFLPCSFGYRPHRSLYDAVERIVHLRDRGLTWVVDADVRDCFGSLDHRLLTRFITEAAPDPTVARLLTAWIAPPRRNGRPPPVRGIPLGAPISPLLCNLYLHRLDRGLRRRSLQSVRYADDFVLLCKSEFQAEFALRATEKMLGGLELALHPIKTRLVSFDDGFDFLGVRFEGSDYSYQVDGKRITVDHLPPEYFYYHADGYE